MILDGTSLVTIFFSKGRYFYHSTKRIFNQPGSAEFTREIFGAISEIRQFASVQKLEDQIDEIQFAGLGEQQVVRLAEDMSDIDSNIKLSAVVCPSYVKIKENAKQFPYFVYPVAGLARLSTPRLDILTANRKSADKFIKKQNLLKVALPAGGFLLLLLLIYGAMTAFNIMKEYRLRELTIENNDVATIENANRYEQISNVITGVGARQGALNILNKYLGSYPIPDSEINNIILKAAEKYGVAVIVNSYDANTGIFSITAQSSEVEQINQFIAELMKMNDFEKIDYTGYNAIEETKEDSGGWQINVVCTLAARNTESENAEEGA